MPVDRRLADRFRSVAEALLPDDVLAQERAVNGAIGRDATVRADALLPSLPWQRVDFQLTGAVSVGASVGGIFDMPQGGTIERVVARARLAPSTGPFTAHLAVNGTVREALSIRSGAHKVATGASIAMPPGSELTLNVTSDGGAANVTVSVFYRAGGTA